MIDQLSPSSTRPSLLLRIRDPLDEESWRTFVDLYGPLVYHYARRRGLQDADAAEVTQDVLLQVSRSIGSFQYDPQRGRFRAWLGALAHSKVCALRRRTPPRGGSSLSGFEPAAPVAASVWEEQFQQQLLQVAVRRVRQQIEARTWEIFQRAWIRGLPASEVARQLGCDIQSVYVAKSRVLKRLREQVRQLAEDCPSP